MPSYKILTCKKLFCALTTFWDTISCKIVPIADIRCLDRKPNAAPHLRIIPFFLPLYPSLIPIPPHHHESTKQQREPQAGREKIRAEREAVQESQTKIKAGFRASNTKFLWLTDGIFWHQRVVENWWFVVVLWSKTKLENCKGHLLFTQTSYDVLSLL